MDFSIIGKSFFSVFYCDVTILPFFRNIYFIVKPQVVILQSLQHHICKARVQKMLRNARTAAFSDQLFHIFRDTGS